MLSTSFLHLIVLTCVEFYDMIMSLIMKGVLKMFSNQIKELRIKKNLTQIQFGRKLGVSRDVICNFEYGRVEPKPVFIELLCNVFSVNSDWLLYGTGEMFSSEDISSKKISEAIELFNTLNDDFQEFALKQISDLLDLQLKSTRDDYNIKIEENQRVKQPEPLKEVIIEPIN